MVKKKKQNVSSATNSPKDGKQLLCADGVPLVRAEWRSAVLPEGAHRRMKDTYSRVEAGLSRRLDELLCSRRDEYSRSTDPMKRFSFGIVNFSYVSDVTFCEGGVWSVCRRFRIWDRAGETANVQWGEVWSPRRGMMLHPRFLADRAALAEAARQSGVRLRQLLKTPYYTDGQCLYFSNGIKISATKPLPI